MSVLQSMAKDICVRPLTLTTFMDNQKLSAVVSLFMKINTQKSSGPNFEYLETNTQTVDITCSIPYCVAANFTAIYREMGYKSISKLAENRWSCKQDQIEL